MRLCRLDREELTSQAAMATVILTTLQGLDGDHASAAATANACGWRIDEGYLSVRTLNTGDAKDAPRRGHLHDDHVFAARAGAALAFDRGDLTYECEAHT
jgi:hypothetical protein